MLQGMNTKRNPLGFMGTGGIFQRDGWWHIQYRDPETKKNVQINAGRKKSDATVKLALLMIGVYERRIWKLYEIVKKARPDGLLPEDRSCRSGRVLSEYLLQNPRAGDREDHERTECSPADERARGRNVPGPQRAV